MNDQFRIIAFDADDTLWVNQNYFDEAGLRFKQLMNEYVDSEHIESDLLQIEITNMPIYGFGVKAFTLSMIEAAIRLSGNRVSTETLMRIVDLGKDILNQPVELLQGVEEVLEKLSGKYKLIVITKGDLLDQERKLNKSGLERYLDHTEILSDKQPQNYSRLFGQLGYKPKQILMIGNSFKSDILPILEIGGYAAYVPYHSTWAHEQVDDRIINPRLIRIKKITDILPYLI